jgi:hypothetical protein
VTAAPRPVSIVSTAERSAGISWLQPAPPVAGAAEPVAAEAVAPDGQPGARAWAAAAAPAEAAARPFGAAEAPASLPAAPGAVVAAGQPGAAARPV